MEQQTTGNRATDIAKADRATDKERQRQSDRQTEPQSARPRD